MSRPRDNQLRCPYCHRHLARVKGEYQAMKFCPSCGTQLPPPGAHRFDSMMRGAQYTTRACSLQVIAALVATAGALQGFLR